MKVLLRILFLLVITHYWTRINAQQNYPQHYFRDPLNIPIQLVANFGELRPDHFHMGLDIRTQSRENLPVFAAADGYISHIRIEKYGYGRAIFIKHPNGYTTLYGHLNSFYDELQQYLEDKQYKEQKWEQDFDLPANMFPVVKGQFIANSGNTGGSQGPHLHFEIRDSKTGNNIDPLLFGLDVRDNIPPILYSLYWYDRRYSIYDAELHQILVVKKNGLYNTKDSVVKVSSPIVTLAARMEDMNNASSFRYGVYHAALYMDDSLLFEYTLDNFSYDDTRYVNACMDYRKWIQKNLGIQYLSVLPGNKMDIFTPLETDGKVLLRDTLKHAIQIELSDEQQNVTTINFLLQLDTSMQFHYSLPANSFVCDVNEVNDISTKNAKIHFDKNAFYDALWLSVYETTSGNERSVSPTIHIGDYTIPVHDDYDVSIKANNDLNDSLKDKVVMQMQSGNASSAVKGEWNNNWMVGSFDVLGDVHLMIDTTAPAITAVGWKNNSIFKSQKKLTVKCRDDISSIASFTALLDGNWLMFSRKDDYFIYSFDEHCTAGAHALTITATDISGNTTTQTFNFNKQ